MNIEIDEKLMAAAMKAGGYLTKKETIEAALKMHRCGETVGGRGSWNGR